MRIPCKSRRNLNIVRWSAALLAVSGITYALTPVTAQAGGPSAAPGKEKPTIVLVHGAFADSSSWNGVVKRLQQNGYTVAAPANPLRGIPQDSTYIASFLKSVKGPIVLVGHSYGGEVISQAAAGNNNVKALVYINAIMPDVGESFASLSAKFAPAALTKALKQVPFRNGDGTTGTDVYVQPNKLHQVFAADLPTSQTDIMAVTQRPIALSAFTDKLTGAAWRNKPVYVLVGKQDQAINPSLERYEAKRANARKTVEIDSSHVSLVSHPQAVKNLIADAAENYMRK
ncbi:alpha/beta fold hydrolase [Streptomyces olivochromogenes]|uniref:Alpha/beta hydrolase n=1 Tax=Streptomyces olivochromogenes TaxID=1963 RepID=A0A286PH29_STROL|nr:alpha/beta hydrolase [Streptomyces olivochromogenes]KUN34627.1 alpha/beta hydrolase [Streptomyces olivochromogenes]GAX58858.1 alpha/beta hydrolase [Streptomyces olivochromogenes]